MTIFAPTSYHLRPNGAVHYNGNLYWPAAYDEGSTWKVAVVKTNEGLTTTSGFNASASSSVNAEQQGALIIGNVIHFIYHNSPFSDPATWQIRYIQFDCTTETWSTEETVADQSMPYVSFQGVSYVPGLVQDGAGNLLACVWGAEVARVMGNDVSYDRLQFYQRNSTGTSGTWSNWWTYPAAGTEGALEVRPMRMSHPGTERGGTSSDIPLVFYDATTSYTYADQRHRRATLDVSAKALLHEGAFKNNNVGIEWAGTTSSPVFVGNAETLGDKGFTAFAESNIIPSLPNPPSHGVDPNLASHDVTTGGYGEIEVYSHLANWSDTPFRDVFTYDGDDPVSESIYYLHVVRDDNTGGTTIYKGTRLWQRDKAGNHTSWGWLQTDVTGYPCAAQVVYLSDRKSLYWARLNSASSSEIYEFVLETYLKDLAGEANSASDAEGTLRTWPSDIVNPTWTYDTWPGDPLTLVTPASAGRRSDSVADLTNGDVVYVYVEGADIKQAIFADVPDLLEDNAVVNNSKSVGTILSGMTEPAATVYRGSNGELYLLVNYKSDTLTSGRSRSLLYHSASGNATDWSLTQTIRDVTFADDSQEGLSYWGIPYETPSGAMVVTGSYWLYGTIGGSPYNWTGYGMWRSTDGSAWSLIQYFAISGPVSLWVDAPSRMIWSDDNGRLYSHYGGQYSGAEGYYLYSDDQGLSWSKGSNDANRFQWFFGDEGAEKTYRVNALNSSTDIGIYEVTPSMDVTGPWSYTLHKQYDLKSAVGWASHYTAIQLVDYTWVFMLGGHMMAIGTEERPTGTPGRLRFYQRDDMARIQAAHQRSQQRSARIANAGSYL